METLKYRLLTAIRYFGDALFYPFFALYLKSTGLIEDSIGFILSITPIIAIIMNPIYSYFCKNLSITRNVLRIITVLEAIVIIAIGFSTDFMLISILTICLAIFGSCHYGLLDSLTAVYATDSNVNYSTIRIFGSIAYIVATSCGGLIAQAFGYQITFISASVLFIASGVMYSFLKPLSKIENSKKQRNFKVILKNKSFITFIIFYLMFASVMTSVDAFFSVFLETKGISSSQYGFIYSYYVGFEVIVLLVLSKWFKKVNPNLLLLIASFLFVIRMFINFSNLPVGWVIAFSGLRGISYAILLHTMFSYIIKLVGIENTTSAILIVNLGNAIIVALGNNLFGQLIAVTSYQTLYLSGMICASIGFLIGLARFIYYKVKKKQDLHLAS